MVESSPAAFSDLASCQYSGDVANSGLGAWAMQPPCGIWMECLALGFSLCQLIHCSHLGTEPVDRKTSFSFSLSYFASLKLCLGWRKKNYVTHLNFSVTQCFIIEHSIFSNNLLVQMKCLFSYCSGFFPLVFICYFVFGLELFLFEM